jgi:type II secretory pathway component GspD/PulD (secretin)
MPFGIFQYARGLLARRRLPPAAPVVAVAAALAAALAVVLAVSIASAQTASPPAPTAASARLAAKSKQAANQENAAQARQAYEQGLRAERAGDWQTALEAYSAATAQSPRDQAIHLREEIARSEVARQHTEQAEREILGGQEDRARASLEAALRVDPTYSVARERLLQITAALPPTPQAAAQATFEPDSLRGLAQIHAPEGARNFDFRGTTRGAYGEIARQFGLTAAFDGDLADRQIQFRVPGLDFETAMRVLGEQTGTFWRAVDAHTFYVAADTPDKRRDYDPEVKKTIVLQASETNDEMTETTRMVREIVGIRRSDLDVKTHTLTVRDTQENVALAQALVQEVEQSRGEALLEIDILEVNRTLARNMGITPPTTAQAFTLSAAQLRELQQAPNIGTLDQILQTIFGGQNPLAASGGSASMIPPVIAVGGGKTLFLATLPGVSGNLSQALSLVKRAQRVLLRVQDGRPASFFVGEHFPITLALLAESVIAPATQFTNAVPAGSFPRTDYNVGVSPSSVTTGSFNGDASLDVAVVNHGANTVSILLGNGDGTFGGHTDFATGVAPVAVVAADFDKDGRQDLAVANQTDNTVSILRGNGDGTFAAHTDIPVGTGPVALVTADFNKDGNPDLAVLNQTTNTVSILLGNGDGTFKPKQDYAIGTTPSAMTFGDFNNDGNIDLVATNHGANTLSMLLGKGDGTFSSRTDFDTSTGPSSVAAADFNGDGRLDLAVTNQTVNTVSIFAGNGDGTFSTRTDYATGIDPVAVIAADFNADSHPDLVVANQTDNTVSIFLGLGDGTLLTPFPLSTGNGPVALAQGALTSSEAATATLPDLVVANQSSDSISVILNSSNISVTPNAPLTSYPGSEYVDIGLKVHATPRLHPNNEITLDLQFDISAVSGQNVNGIPILTNRTINQSVRLRDDQTSVLSGIFQRNEVHSIGGWPGLAEIGPVGYLFGPHSKQDTDTELIIAITPRQLRLAPRTDSTIYAGRGAGPAPAPAPAAIGPFPGGGPAPGAVAPAVPAAAPPGAPQPGAAPALPAPGAPATPTQPSPAPPGPVTQPAPTTPGPTN